MERIDTVGPPWWCDTCESWRHTQPCGRDECPRPTDAPTLATDADVIAAVRGVLWDAMRGRAMGGDRTLVGMVKQLVAQRDEALENRRGEYDLRVSTERQRDELLACLRRMCGMYGAYSRRLAPLLAEDNGTVWTFERANELALEAIAKAEGSSHV